MTLKKLESAVADLQSSIRANSSQLSTLILQQQSTVQDLSAIRSSMERLEKHLSYLNLKQNHNDNVSEEVHVDELTLESAQNSDLSGSKMEENLTIVIEIAESEVLDNTQEVVVHNLVPKLPFYNEVVKEMNDFRQQGDSYFCWEPGPNASYQREIISESTKEGILIDGVDSVYEEVVVENSLDASSISVDSHFAYLLELLKDIAVQLEEDLYEYKSGDGFLGNSTVNEAFLKGLSSDNVILEVSRSLMSEQQKEFLNFKFKNDLRSAQVVKSCAQQWYIWEIYGIQLPAQMRNKHSNFLKDLLTKSGFSNRDYCRESNIGYVINSYWLYNVVGSTRQSDIVDGDPAIKVGGDYLRKTTMSKGRVTTITIWSVVSVSWNVQLSPSIFSVTVSFNKAIPTNILVLLLLPAPIIATTHLNSLLIMAIRSKLLQNIMCNFPIVCSSQSAGFVRIISWGTTVISLVMILARESRKFLILHKSLVCWTMEQRLLDIPSLHKATCHTFILIVDETYNEDMLSRKPKFAVTDIELTTQSFLFYAAHHLHNDDRGASTQSAETGRPFVVFFVVGAHGFYSILEYAYNVFLSHAGSSGYVHSVDDIDLISCTSSATAVAEQISWSGFYGTHFRFLLWGLSCLAMLSMPVCTMGSVLLACYGVTRPTKETSKQHVQDVKDQLDLLDVFALDHHMSKTVKWIVLRVLAQVSRLYFLQLLYEQPGMEKSWCSRNYQECYMGQNQNGGSAFLETLVKMILCFDPGIARCVCIRIYSLELHAVLVIHPMTQKMLVESEAASLRVAFDIESFALSKVLESRFFLKFKQGPRRLVEYVSCCFSLQHMALQYNNVRVRLFFVNTDVVFSYLNESLLIERGITEAPTILYMVYTSQDSLIMWDHTIKVRNDGRQAMRADKIMFLFAPNQSLQKIFSVAILSSLLRFKWFLDLFLGKDNTNSMIDADSVGVAATIFTSTCAHPTIYGRVWSSPYYCHPCVDYPHPGTTDASVIVCFMGVLGVSVTNILICDIGWVTSDVSLLIVTKNDSTAMCTYDTTHLVKTFNHGSESGEAYVFEEVKTIHAGIIFSSETEKYHCYSVKSQPFDAPYEDLEPNSVRYMLIILCHTMISWVFFYSSLSIAVAHALVCTCEAGRIGTLCYSNFSVCCGIVVIGLVSYHIFLRTDCQWLNLLLSLNHACFAFCPLNHMSYYSGLQVQCILPFLNLEDKVAVKEEALLCEAVYSSLSKLFGNVMGSTV